MTIKQIWIFALILTMAVTLYSTRALADSAKKSISLTADIGKITCTFTSPFDVNAKRVGDDLVVTVKSPGQINGARSIPSVTVCNEGFTVKLPYAWRPVIEWLPSRLIFHWTTSTGDSGKGLFNIDKPPVYPLGPGDELNITVYNVPDMKQTVTVDPKGYITFPVLDKIQVEGYTVNELQRRMESLLAQYVKDPQVNIQLKEYGSRYVNVLGEVGRPGRIPLKGALRVLDSISQAGGFTVNSGAVEIRRKDSTGKTHTLKLTQEELLAGGGNSNIYLLDRDVVNVQGVKSVFISGEVKNPGAFPYNSDLTLLKVITLAGGFSQWAKKDKVDILREKNGKTEVIHANATKIEKGSLPDIGLESNDHVVVRERKFF